MKKIVTVSAGVLIVTLATVGIVYAAFSHKNKYNGASFSVGSADIKLLDNLSLGISQGNLVDEKQGPAFSNIGANWAQEFPMKIYNNSASVVTITTNANYETVNDPDDLRSIIYVEPFAWNDTNNNGQIDDGEKGQSFGNKAIIKWKTEGLGLGPIASGQVAGYILKFSTLSVSDTKQGKSGSFDFEFNSSTL